jgi:hypothetical protein
MCLIERSLRFLVPQVADFLFKFVARHSELYDFMTSKEIGRILLGFRGGDEGKE